MHKYTTAEGDLQTLQHEWDEHAPPSLFHWRNQGYRSISKPKFQYFPDMLNNPFICSQNAQGTV